MNSAVKDVKQTEEASGKFLDEAMLSENCRAVLENRYLKKSPSGECIETPADLFRRVADSIAKANLKYRSPEDTKLIADAYYRAMITGKFMPNSPTLMNAGREMGMLSACFVLPIEDSIDSIFDTIKNTALIQKAGGGTGFCFDKLRPAGDWIKSSGGTTSGPISFWRVLSEATNAIQQGAFRRGANMGIMHIEHCDIIKFIHAKQDLKNFQNYNISVKVPDAWVDAYKKNPNSPHVVSNFRTGIKYVIPKSLNVHLYQLNELIPLEKWEAYDCDGDGIGFSDGKKIEVWTRGQVWDTIITNAWTTGEPGLFFTDRVKETNPTPNVGEMEATNPCGEQPLLPYESCNLGSINLGSVVNKASIDWDGLSELVRMGVLFLDNVIDENNYVIPEIDAICKNNRKIGLGIMGFADALYKLGIPYNSDEAVKLGEKFMKFINDESHAASEELAKERGVFPNWEGSRWQTEWKRKQRNACSTTVAPTGTISIIANCSCGIEPLFSLVYYRHVMRDHTGKAKTLAEVNELFMSVAEQNGYWGYSKDELVAQIVKDGSLHNLDKIPENIRKVFVCAHDVEPDWHVKMQAAFQRHCDSAISKTINMPHSATVDSVKDVYLKAHALGCKGITVYRDGCRKGQAMSTSASDTAAVEAPVEKKVEEKLVVSVKKAPEVLPAIRIRQSTPFGHMHVNVSYDPVTKREMEVFAQLGKGGDIASADLEAICRMLSLFLRSNGSIDLVIDQLEDIGSYMTLPTKDGHVKSLGDGLAKALKRYKVYSSSIKPVEDLSAIAKAMKSTRRKDTLDTAFKMKCPECPNGTILFQEGCQKCSSCGYSRC